MQRPAQPTLDAPAFSDGELPSDAYVFRGYCTASILAGGAVASLALMVVEGWNWAFGLSIVLAIVSVILLLATAIRRGVDRNLRNTVLNRGLGALILGHVRYLMRSCDRIEDTQGRLVAAVLRLERLAELAEKRAQAEFASGYLEGVQAHRRAANGMMRPTAERTLYVVPEVE